MVMMARDFSDLDEMIGRLQAIESRHNFIEQLAPHGSHQGDRKRLSYDGSPGKQGDDWRDVAALGTYV